MSQAKVFENETLSFMRRLWDLVHALEVASKRMSRDLGVTGPQRLVIRVVGRAPGITARELADTLGIHPSTLTGIVARLVKAKYLSRAIDKEDRRVARFSLTARGKLIDREKRGTVEAAVRRALGRASDAQATQTIGLIALVVEELARDADA